MAGQFRAIGGMMWRGNFENVTNTKYEARIRPIGLTLYQKGL